MDDPARPAPERAGTKRHPIALGVLVFATLFLGDLYLNHGTNLALTLPVSLAVGVWAGHRAWRRA